MADSTDKEGVPPQIDGGTKAQAIVEYTGSQMGAVTYRGSSGRQYCFSASPSDKRKYVVREDLERFRHRPDFRVHEETFIDPEVERINRLVAKALGQHTQGVLESG